MEITIIQVNAFTRDSEGGNPAGVVLQGKGLKEEEMQSIAKEADFSETVFVTGLKEDVFNIRFFTPLCEVDLCGHGTIATFYSLCQEGYINPIEEGRKIVYQRTKAGELAVELIYSRGEVKKIIMEQTSPKELGEVQDLQSLSHVMKIEEEDIGVLDRKLPPQIISTGLADIILPIRSKRILDCLEPDMEGLAQFTKSLDTIGLHAFYLPHEDSSLVYTRNFAPLVGIDEESATGTSNGALIYYLKRHKLLEGKSITSYQGDAMNRPSIIHCEIETGKEPYQVKVGGEARIIEKKRIRYREK